MERHFAIPRTPEIVLAEFHAARRFRLRAIGWTGIFTFLFLTFMALEFLVFLPRSDSILDTIFALVWTILWLGFSGYLLHTYCQAGQFRPLTIASVLEFARLLALDCGLRRLPPPAETDVPVEVNFSDTGLTLSMAGAATAESVSFPWRAFANVWQFTDCWMFVFGNGNMFLPVPASMLDEESRKLITAQMESAGGKIRLKPGLGLGTWWRQWTLWS